MSNPMKDSDELELNRTMTVFASHVYECANEHREWQPSEEGKLKEAISAYTQRQVVQARIDELTPFTQEPFTDGVAAWRKDIVAHVEDRIAQLQQQLNDMGKK